MTRRHRPAPPNVSFRFRAVLSCALAAVAFAPPALAGDWPHWRGPNQDGTTDETGLPTTWSDTENVAWRAELPGRGASTPIVWGDRIFLTAQRGDCPPGQPPFAAEKNEVVANSGDYDVLHFSLCHRKSDGALLWSRETRPDELYPTHGKHGHATPSCTTDGERVYFWFGSGLLFAADFDGKVLWERDLWKEYGPFAVIWGHGSSPILHGENLILLCEHEPGAYVLAVDRRTGENRYRVEREKGKRSYATPLLVRAGEREEMIVPTAGKLEGLDPATGERLWWAKGLSLAVVPTAVASEGVVFASGGYYNAPALAVRVGGRGDVSDDLVWFQKNGAGYTSSFVVAGDVLCNFTERGIAKGMDPATGETLWKERLGGEFSASPVLSEGKLWIPNEDGETFVVEPSREGMKLVAKNVLPERTLGSVAVSDGRIYLRTDKALYCFAD